MNTNTKTSESRLNSENSKSVIEINIINLQEDEITVREMQLAILHMNREIIRFSAESKERLSLETANRLETLNQLQENLINKVSVNKSYFNIKPLSINLKPEKQNF